MCNELDLEDGRKLLIFHYAGHGILKSGRLHLACIEREQNIHSELNTSSSNLIAPSRTLLLDSYSIGHRLKTTHARAVI